LTGTGPLPSLLSVVPPEPDFYLHRDILDRALSIFRVLLFFQALATLAEALWRHLWRGYRFNAKEYLATLVAFGGTWLLLRYGYSLGARSMGLVSRCRLWTITMTPLLWVVALVAYDFLLYWSHRLHHVLGFAWLGHATHHTCVDYTLGCYWREGWLVNLTNAFPPMILLTLIGIPLEVTWIAQHAYVTYSCFYHTELVGRLPGLDGWLVTPSNHRVHHFSDPRFMNKNFGGILIVWDRLLGTHMPEPTEKTGSYGIHGDDYDTYNPLKIQYQAVVRLVRAIARAPSVIQKVRTFFC
jgi:sterol desaturase/sphingolipid hydroxylase (fatty acid hydroxylase superfamily)